MNRNINIKKIMAKSEINYRMAKLGCPIHCPVCGSHLKVWLDYNNELTWNSPTQKAHFLSNDKANNKKYGSKLLDHHLNWALVCSLQCNNAIQVRNNPELEKYIVLRIKDL